MGLTIIKNIDLIKDYDKYDVILIGTNIYNKMSDGFQLKIRKVEPMVLELNMGTKYADNNKLGKRVSLYDSTPIYSLCFIVKGYNFRPDKESDYLDYNALETCIKTANLEFQGKKVATTLIGSSIFDGNGDRVKILKILEENSDKIDLYVYDYIQNKYRYEYYIKPKGDIKKSDLSFEEKGKLINESKTIYSEFSTFDNSVKGRKEKIKNNVLRLLKK